MKFVPGINSLWPGDARWLERSGSTFTQIMACCLMAPSHYQNQYWLIIDDILWYYFEIIFTVSTQATILYDEFKDYTFNITATSPRGQWVNSSAPGTNYAKDQMSHAKSMWLSSWIQYFAPSCVLTLVWWCRCCRVHKKTCCWLTLKHLGIPGGLTRY